jgi:phosphoglycolate phosphatase
LNGHAKDSLQAQQRCRSNALQLWWSEGAMERPRGLIFDLDGTLTDSAPAIGRAVNRVWAGKNRKPLTDIAVREYIGDGPAILIARARKGSGLACDPAAETAETDEFMRFYAEDGPGGDIFPGAVEVCEKLVKAGLQLAVCTNKPQDAAWRLLSALGLAPFMVGCVGGDIVPFRKPDPAHVLAALDLFKNVPPSGALMVGDGRQDVAAAEAAGLGVVVASYGYGGVAAERPDLPVIKTINDLPPLLGVGEV